MAITIKTHKCLKSICFLKYVQIFPLEIFYQRDFHCLLVFYYHFNTWNLFKTKIF
jgi:hypothetical protein